MKLEEYPRLIELVAKFTVSSLQVVCVCGGGGGVCVYCIHIDSRFIVGVDLCLCVHVCVVDSCINGILFSPIFQLYHCVYSSFISKLPLGARGQTCSQQCSCASGVSPPPLTEVQVQRYFVL